MAVGGWVALSAAALLAGSGSPLGRASMDSYHVLFLIGLAAAWVVQRGTPARSGLIAVLGVAAFLTAGVTEDMGWLSRDGLLPRLAYGLASGAVVVGTVLTTYALTRPDPTRPPVDGGGLGWAVRVP